eukprot:CAMPEP_0174310964 /NCGR_PEP_ID=MMETSP0810-20121108/3398_1 /TAXON_ID=73025 ORGANISM="Eutreptiella gymnastica-like, Strain CCMP1594" /NCGR_SAMPLE_ID=MMETSP0810 /ASSEMBLY_ACC=CAM_ASM_000659 /LENGTH=1745 /DNA_ID=CAMNT_0015419047 /DNA_START=94 /DNA_END=5331 /DNA_ORIENTATION=-
MPQESMKREGLSVDVTSGSSLAKDATRRGDLTGRVCGGGSSSRSSSVRSDQSVRTPGSPPSTERLRERLNVFFQDGGGNEVLGERIANMFVNTMERVAKEAKKEVEAKSRKPFTNVSNCQTRSTTNPPGKPVVKDTIHSSLSVQLKILLTHTIEFAQAQVSSSDMVEVGKGEVDGLRQKIADLENKLSAALENERQPPTPTGSGPTMPATMDSRVQTDDAVTTCETPPHQEQHYFAGPDDEEAKKVRDFIRDMEEQNNALQEREEELSQYKDVVAKQREEIEALNTQIQEQLARFEEQMVAQKQQQEETKILRLRVLELEADRDAQLGDKLDVDDRKSKVGGGEDVGEKHEKTNKIANTRAPTAGNLVEIKRLEKKRHDLSVEVDELRDGPCRPRKEEANLQAENSEKDTRLQEIEAARGDLLLEFGGLEGVRTSLSQAKIEVASLQAENVELRARVEASQTDSRRDPALDELRENLVEAIKREVILQDHNNSQEARIQELEHSQGDFRRELQEVESLRASLCVARKMEATLHAESNIKDAKIQELHSTLSRLKRELQGCDKLRNDVTTLQAERGERDARVHELETSRGDLLRELEELRGCLMQANHQVSLKQEEIETLTVQQGQLTHDLCSARAVCAEKTKKDARVHELETSRGDLLRELEEQRGNLMQANRQVSLKQEEIDSLNVKQGHLNQELCSARSRYEETRSLCAQLEETVAHKCEEIERWKRVAAENQKHMDGLQKQMSLEVEAANNKKETDVQFLERRLRETVDELQAATAQFAERQIEMEQTCRRLHAEAENAQLQAKDHLAHEVLKVQKESIHKQEEIKQKEVLLREELEKKLHDYQSHAAQIKTVEEKFEAKAAELKLNAETKERQWQQDRQELESKVARQINDLKTEQEAANAREKEVQALRAEVEQCRTEQQKALADVVTQRQTAENHKQEMERQVNAAKHEMGLLEIRAVQMESKANQNELKASKVEQDCRRKETELTALRAAAAQQDTELKQKAQLLETTQKEVKILEGQLQELQMECRTAKQSAVQKEEIVRKMQGQLDSFQGQWDRLQDDFRAKHQELVQKTGKHSQALAILEDKNGALEAKEQQLVVLQEQLGADAKKLQDTLASCALVQKDLEVANSKNNQQARELQSVRHELSQKDGEIQVLVQHTEELKRLNVESEHKCKLAIDQLEAKVTSMQEELAVKQQQLQQKVTKQMDREELENELQQAQQTVRTLKDHQTQRDEELKQLRLKLMDFEGNSKQSELEQYQEVDALILELSSKEQELMKKHLETLDLQGKVRYLQQELQGTHFAQQTHSLQTQVDGLTIQLQAAKEDSGEKEKELQTMNQEVEEIVKELQAAKDVIAQRDMEVQLLNGEMEKLAHLVSESSTACNMLQQASTEVGQLQSMLAVVQQEKNQCQEEMRLQAAGWNQRWEEASKKAESQGAELVNALQRLAEREQQLQQLEFASQRPNSSSEMLEQGCEVMCNKLIDKMSASPCPRGREGVNQQLASSSNTNWSPGAARLAVSPTRVGWSPEQRSDEDVLLEDVRPVPFTSASPIRPPKLSVYIGAEMSPDTVTVFTIGCIRGGSTHWSRLRKCKAGTKGIERWKHNGHTVQNQVASTLCHPKLHSETQQLIRRWSMWSSWFQRQRTSRQIKLLQQRCMPTLMLPGPADLTFFSPLNREGTTLSVAAPCPHRSGSAWFSAKRSTGAGGLHDYIDEFLDIESDFDLSAPLFPENRPGLLESMIA